MARVKGSAIGTISSLARKRRSFLRQLLRLDHGVMRRGRTLDDLPRIGAQQLIVEAAADEQEAALGAAILDHIRDRRLNVDLGQDFDIIGVGDQEVLRRRDAAMRLVKIVFQLSASARVASSPSAS